MSAKSRQGEGFVSSCQNSGRPNGSKPSNTFTCNTPESGADSDSDSDSYTVLKATSSSASTKSKKSQFSHQAQTDNDFSVEIQCRKLDCVDGDNKQNSHESLWVTGTSSSHSLGTGR